MAEKGPDVLDLMIRHELSLGELYELFAAAFPERGEFWRPISQDERRHSRWLENLGAEESSRSWLLFESGLKPAAIRSSIGFVETQIAKARGSGFTPLEALSISRDLENALLEKYLSKIGASAPAGIRSVIANLAAETKRHRETIAAALEEEKGRVR
jgi:rubrerythrin